MTKKIEFYLPLLLLIIGTIIALVTNIDLELAKIFFDSESSEWYLSKNSLVELGNHWGPKIAMTFALLAAIGLLISFGNPKYIKHRPVLLFIFLCYLIGPAIIVNGVLKDSWNRPRPREVVNFDGNYEFVKVLVPGSREFKGKSFPGGHASAGFVMVLFYFLFKNRSTKRAITALLIALGFGVYLSFARIASGAHFFSDNLWSFGICWFVSYFLYYRWYLKYLEKPKKEFIASQKRWKLLAVTLSVIILLAFLPFLLTDDFYDKYPLFTIPIPKDIKTIEINGYVKRGNAHLYPFEEKNKIGIKSRALGRAFPGIQIRQDYKLRQEGDTLYVTLEIEPDGYYLDYQSHNNIRIPEHIFVVWNLNVYDGISDFLRNNYRVESLKPAK
ncbi:phosphatase PAP2 family protein [bacterium]|nr:phosphatase PAP2 family protein [bacterium]